MEQTKNSIQFCKKLIQEALNSENVELFLKNKVEELSNLEDQAIPDMVFSVLEAHESLCAVKKMGPKEAFGHNPAVFYGLALNGECGELSGSLIKVIRLHGTRDQEIAAVRAEIADILIYAILLAWTNDIDPNKIVSEKSKIVIERAISGYYGGALHE